MVEYPEGVELNDRFDEYEQIDLELESENSTDEIDEYYNSLNSHNDTEYQTTFEGGFKVDTTILDETPSNQDTEE